MSSKVRTARGSSRMYQRANEWLRIAALIDTRSVNSSDICADLGISRNTFVRYQADLEHIYGFRIEYVRPDGSAPGWYEVRDWGVLDRERVIAAHGHRESK